MSNIEENITVTIDSNPVMLKPILFTDYTAVTKYNIKITYEDYTVKNVELIQNDTTRPYKIVYKKEGQLFTVIGVPKIYEINERSKYCDFVNRTMDSKDLLFEMDCSEKFQCTKARFYLKDIRDIIDIVAEGYIEDPEDNMQVDGTFTMYPIYLHEHSCQNVIHCTVDDNLKVTLTARVTKMGETLSDNEYSDFTILSVSNPVIIDPDVEPEVNKVPLVFTEDSLDKEIKVILKYFVKEINHPVFDEFTIIASKQTEDDGTELLTEAITTQDTEYLGDNSREILDMTLTPGYKPYEHITED